MMQEDIHSALDERMLRQEQTPEHLNKLNA